MSYIVKVKKEDKKALSKSSEMSQKSFVEVISLSSEMSQKSFVEVISWVPMWHGIFTCKWLYYV